MACVSKLFEIHFEVIFPALQQSPSSKLEKKPPLRVLGI